MLKFRAIDLNYRPLFAEQDFGRGFDDARLSGAGGPKKQKIADGAARGIQAGAVHLIDSDERIDCFILSYDFGAKSGLKFLEMGTAFAGVKYFAHCALLKSRVQARALAKSVCAVSWLIQWLTISTSECTKSERTRIRV